MIGIPKTDVDTPLLWVDLERLEQNIAALGRGVLRGCLAANACQPE